MPGKKIREFLDQNHIRYVTIQHSRAYTAQEVAESAHISGRDLAKTVMVKVDGKMAMAVLPASFKVDFDLLREAIGTADVELATEKEFKNQFPECEVGAMPPFGNLYGMDVYMASGLHEEDEIAFNAGSHTELIRLRFRDYERLVAPTIIQFSVPA
jgi:Ala-tRNA(Pro) deacylase